MKIKSILSIITNTLITLFSLTIVFCNNGLLYAQGLTPPPATTGQYTGSLDANPIILWINFAVNWLSVIIILGGIIMLAVAGMQYSAARDNSQGIQDAKKKIGTIAVSLLAYFFLYSFFQWLVPGGVF